jgi:predicted RNA-binding Zn-ribbon protein involved in translation (DUF1610 family)
MYHQCPSCNNISNEIELTIHSNPCPKCGATGEARIQFPNISCYKILKMISYFHDKARKRIGDDVDKLRQELRKITLKDYSYSSIKPLIREIRITFSKNPDRDNGLFKKVKSFLT